MRLIFGSSAGHDMDVLRCNGTVLHGKDGQPVFRFEQPPCAACATCANRCHDERDVEIPGATLAALHQVRACLLWPRRAFNRAVMTVYGLPMVGLAAGVVAGSGTDSVAGEALAVSISVVLGFLGGRLLTSRPTPEIETFPTPGVDSFQTEDPGKER